MWANRKPPSVLTHPGSWSRFDARFRRRCVPSLRILGKNGQGPLRSSGSRSPRLRRPNSWQRLGSRGVSLQKKCSSATLQVELSGGKASRKKATQPPKLHPPTHPHPQPPPTPPTPLNNTSFCLGPQALATQHISQPFLKVLTSPLLALA